MKNLLAAFLVAGLGTTAPAQGLVNFFNNSTTLISASGSTIPGQPGNFYFGLLIAPPGTTDRRLFSFSGIYGTNQATSGRFSGGGNLAVPGWPAGTTKAFMVAGWPASLGHDWNPDWLISEPNVFGFSAIAQGVAGGFDGTTTIPNLNIFGLQSINSGFNLHGPCLSFGFYGLTVDPAAITVVPGTTVTFRLGVLACPPPNSYQWYFNNEIIPGATRGTYEIAHVQSSNAGIYYAVISSDYWGVRQSPVGHLAVLLPPTITTQPPSQTAEPGSDTRFSVHATGSTPLSYRWLFNGNVDLTGASTYASLQLTNLQFSQAGAYSVVVTNAVGAATSTPAMLNVISPVPRRMVPGLLLTAEPSALINIDYAPQLDPQDWQTFPTVSLTNSPQFYFDLSSPLPAQRFYRVWQAGAPSVVPSVSLPGVLPALTLTGAIGSRVKVEGINQIGPTDAWFTLDTVTLTETPELYFDTSAIGQPPRLYRLTPVP